MIGVVGVRIKDPSRKRDVTRKFWTRSSVVDEELAEFGGDENVARDDPQIAQPLAQHEPIAIGIEEMLGM